MGDPPSPIVQSKVALIVDKDVDTLTFDSPVGDGNILVVFCLIGVFGDNDDARFVPTDTQGNMWVEPDSFEGFPDPPPGWYALNSKPGSTSISFPGFLKPAPSIDGSWVIAIEVTGPWTDFDAYNATQNDPPSLETVTVSTTVDGDIVLALFAGPSFDPEDPGITVGDESTQIDLEIAPYASDDPWAVIVEWQQAGMAGDIDSTATFDTDVTFYNFAQAIAFKVGGPVPAKPRIGPLSMDNFVPYNI